MGTHVEYGHARVELRLGVLLYRTCLSRSVVDASASAAPGGGGLELRGVGRCDGAGVVLGVESGGLVELYVSADEGLPESVSVGVRCSADQSANDIHRGFAGRQIPKTLVSRGGSVAHVVPNAFVTSCSRWAVTSKASRIRRFSCSRPPSQALGLLSLALVLLLPSARCTLEFYILVHINSSVSVDRWVIFFFFHKSSVPP
jgi:hypothetical protein